MAKLRSLGVKLIIHAVTEILDYLTQQFHSGKQYSTINSYRSALSYAHWLWNYSGRATPLGLSSPKGNIQLSPPKAPLHMVLGR